MCPRAPPDPEAEADRDASTLDAELGVSIQSGQQPDQPVQCEAPRWTLRMRVRSAAARPVELATSRAARPRSADEAFTACPMGIMMPSMRTTVTLDADTESLLREAMRQRGQTLKQTLNYAVRRGLAGIAGDPERPPFVQRTFPMGVRAGYDLGKLSALEAEMDTEAFLDVTRRLIDDDAGS